MADLTEVETKAITIIRTREYGRSWWLKGLLGLTAPQTRRLLLKLERHGLIFRDPLSAVNDTLWRANKATGGDQ